MPPEGPGELSNGEPFDPQLMGTVDVDTKAVRSHN